MTAKVRLGGLCDVVDAILLDDCEVGSFERIYRLTTVFKDFSQTPALLR